MNYCEGGKVEKASKREDLQVCRLSECMSIHICIFVSYSLHTDTYIHFLQSTHRCICIFFSCSLHTDTYIYIFILYSLHTQEMLKIDHKGLLYFFLTAYTQIHIYFSYSLHTQEMLKIDHKGSLLYKGT